MSEKTIRLNAVVKELNVGINTLAEHLSKKGHAVEAKPTTKITEEQYAILLSDFQSDKKVRDDAKQLVKPKIVKKEEVTVSVPKPKEKVTEEDDDSDDGILIKSGLSLNAAPKVDIPVAPVVEEKPIIEKPVQEKIAPVEVAVEEDDDKLKLTVKVNHSVNCSRQEKNNSLRPVI